MYINKKNTNLFKLILYDKILLFKIEGDYMEKKDILKQLTSNLETINNLWRIL